jgi:hypothetical protein
VIRLDLAPAWRQHGGGVAWPSEAGQDFARLAVEHCYGDAWARPRPDEPIAALIEDPWKRIACSPDLAGCAASFTDPEFAAQGRDTINGQNLRCERDAEGRYTKVHLCPGPEGDADDCLGEDEPRAWSSPIYVDYRSPAAP